MRPSSPGPLLLLCAACSGTAAPQQGSIANRGGTPSPAVLRVTLAVPAHLPPLPELAVPPDEEVSVEKKLCSKDGSVVTREQWAEALEAGGFSAQINSKGWLGDGPLALRFRLGEVVGDLFSTADFEGCRTYEVRVTRPEGDVLRWKSAYSGTELERDMPGCLPIFAPDARFPDSGDTYQFGRCGPDDHGPIIIHAP